MPKKAAIYASKPFSMRLRGDLKTKLERKAKELGISQNDVMVMALNEYLRQVDKGA